MPPPPQRPNNRRGPSGAWNRLKSAPRDDLMNYGLPSKGETRLNDYKAQENYFNRIVERYMKFCHDSRDSLDKQFALLSVTPSAPSTTTTTQNPNDAPSAWSGASSSKYSKPPIPTRNSSTNTSTSTTPLSAAVPAPTSNHPTTASPELQLIHLSMRKLREAIVATHRRDAFAQRAYMFLIRASILTRAWESYHAALLYLLGPIHAATPLAPADWREFAGYRVLDLACRQGDLGGAFALRWGCFGGVGRWELDAVLAALVRDDWALFWRTKGKVDGYVRALMEWAEEGVRLHALKCLGRSYLTVGKVYVEACTGKDWEDLKRAGVGWELEEDGTVVIRRAKAKGT